MKSKAAVKQIRALGPATELLSAQAAREYFDIGVQIERLEKRRKEVRGTLEAALDALPDHSAEIGGYLCTLSRFEREFFKLKEAREKIPMKVLRPFISVTEVASLRVTYKGGSDE